MFVKESMDEICEALEGEILKSDAAQEEKQAMLAKLRKLCSTETNIMLVGATGCGKSSTINALFSCNQQEEYVEIAKVGSRTDPETRDADKKSITKQKTYFKSYKVGSLNGWKEKNHVIQSDHGWAGLFRGHPPIWTC